MKLKCLWIHFNCEFIDSVAFHQWHDLVLSYRFTITFQQKNDPLVFFSFQSSPSFTSFRRRDEKVMNLNPPVTRLLCSYFICRLTRIDWLREITGHHRMIDINFVRKTMIALCIFMNIDIEIYTFLSISIQKRRRRVFFFFFWLYWVFYLFIFSSFTIFIGGDEEKCHFLSNKYEALTLFVKI